MRFLVVSDIHAISEELVDLPPEYGYRGGDGSSFRIEDRNKTKNRLLSLEPCLESYRGEIDALVCLGDFAHQSKRLVMLQVWNDLHEVATRLNIPEVIGITGNHDIASRVEDIADAETRSEFLKEIRPRFPSRDTALSDGYHKDGVGSTVLGESLLVALDTCRLHGLGANEDATREIWSVGQLTDGMIDKAMDAITTCTKEHVLVIMHHHPLKVDQISDHYYDEMKNGPKFLDLLSQSEKNCFVVHGHKHMVNLRKIENGDRPPVILSAASVAAYPYRDQGQHFSNQFHILEIDISQRSRSEGTVLSWDWGAYRWEESKKHSMPHIRKIGPMVDKESVLSKLKCIEIRTAIDREALIKQIPEIEYLSMDEIESLNEKLDPIGRQIVTSKSSVAGMLVQGSLP